MEEATQATYFRLMLVTQHIRKLLVSQQIPNTSSIQSYKVVKEDSYKFKSCSDSRKCLRGGFAAFPPGRPRCCVSCVRFLRLPYPASFLLVAVVVGCCSRGKEEGSLAKYFGVECCGAPKTVSVSSSHHHADRTNKTGVAEYTTREVGSA